MKTQRMCKSNRKNWYNCMKVRSSKCITCCIASQRETGNSEWPVQMHNKMQHGFCGMWNEGFWRLEGPLRERSHVLQLQTFLQFHLRRHLLKWTRMKFPMLMLNMSFPAPSQVLKQHLTFRMKYNLVTACQMLEAGEENTVPDQDPEFQVNHLHV